MPRGCLWLRLTGGGKNTNTASAADMLEEYEMTDVKRYDLQDATERDGCAYMAQDPTGEFVLSSDYDALAAKLADAELVARYEADVAQQAIDQMKAEKARADAAEAALVAAYRLGVEAATDCIGHITQTEDFDAISALPTPTAEELMARIEEERPINWGSDPDAIIEDDEPQIGRDYA